MSGHYPTLPKSLGLGSVFKSFAKSLNAKPPVSVTSINPAIVGGEDLKKLVGQLAPDHPVAMRAAAAAKIGEILGQYSMASVPEIWYRARDMLDTRYSSTVRRPVIRLLRGCIAQGVDLIANRIIYYKEILSSCTDDDPDYDLFLKALVVLTNNGENLGDLMAFNAQGFLRLVSPRLLSSSWGPTFDFVANSIKNGQLDTPTVASLGATMVELAQTHPSAVERVFSTLSSVETASPSVLQFLAAMYAIDGEKYPPVFIDTLARSKQLQVVSGLCTVITTPQLTQCRSVVSGAKLTSAVITLYGCLGAIELAIRTMIAGDSDPVAVATALKTTADLGLDNVNLQILRCLDQLFSAESWEHLPFYVWHSQPTFFDVLKSISPENRYLPSIFFSLQQSFASHHLQCSREQLVDLLLFFHKVLPPESAVFVLRHYADAQLCCALDPLWRDHCAQVLNLFYFVSDSSEVKLECLRTIHVGYQSSMAVFSDVDFDIVYDLFARSRQESDEVVLEYLINNVFTQLAIHCSEAVYGHLCDQLAIEVPKPVPSYRSISSSTMSINVSEAYLHQMAMALVRLFCVTLVRSPAKAARTYRALVAYLHGVVGEYPSIALVVVRLFIRLRVTYEGNLYITQPGDIVGLTSTFGRNKQEEYTPKDSHLWTHPDIVAYIPENYLNRPSRLGITDINLEHWFKMAVDVMEKFYHWEIYSYVWGHFCSQLANLELFRQWPQYIGKIKSMVCNQLTSGIYSVVKIPPDEITPAELQVALIRTMSALMGYHDQFSKRDEDDLIKALILGLGWWETTAVPCINLLTVCCYEIPLSIQRFAPVILTKLQTRVTSSAASTHTLELLMALAQNPQLLANLTNDDFKRIYGIAFKYVQLAQDMTTSTAPSKLDVPWQYVLTMSYRVICEWFLKSDVNDRAKVSEYIIKNMIALDEKLDDNTVGLLDFIAQFTFSNISLSIYHPKLAADARQWMVGNNVISMTTDAKSGESQWVIIRPSGVTTMAVSLAGQPQGDVSSAFYMMQLYHRFDSSSKPVAIPDTPAAVRALSLLERIPTVEFHKVGILYLGPGQTTEDEVLANACGSRRYQQFIKGMGELYRLNQTPTSIYVGGLDTESDMDGQYTRYWRNRNLQVVWHISTMMAIPGQSPERIQLQQRKRHIGNDYVNIFFNESGRRFNFDMIRSQFNFMSIVISPHTWVSEPLVAVDDNSPRFYRVKVYRRSGVPSLFAASHFKLISESHLPQFVRSLAIMADHFAHVWHNPNLPFSIWSQRARALRELREKLDVGEGNDVDITVYS